MLNQDALGALRQLKTELRGQRNLRKGTVRGTRGNFGFVAFEDGTEVFLPPEQMALVFPGDQVEVEISEDTGQRQQARIDSIIEPAFRRFFGHCAQRGKALFAVFAETGYNRWLFIPPRDRAQAVAGDLVECELLQHPFHNEGKGQARVRRVIGGSAEPGVESRFVAARWALAEQWPPAEPAAVAGWQARIDQLAGEREDLGALPFVTIDAPYSRDLDDALYAQATEDGWRLQVAVADAAALVVAGSALDTAAAERASTAYLPHEQRPMLPPELAENLLSLLPGERRLAIVCTLEVSGEGETRSCNFRPAVICSAAKLGYRQVSEHFTAGIPLAAVNAAVESSLAALAAVANALHNHRRLHQLAGEDRPDYQFELDSHGKIARIERQDKTLAHLLVEECMLAANRAVARTFSERGLASVFTCHAGFRPERVADAAALLERYLPGKFTAADMQELSGFIAVQRALADAAAPYDLAQTLRRLYTPGCLSATPAPHMGLGLSCYQTMTSPIRRYQDLLVQRQLHALLAGNTPPAYPQEWLDEIKARQDRIRKADEEAELLLQLEYAARALPGADHRATVVRVSARELGVRLDDSGITGVLAVADLPGKYRFDALELGLTNEESAIYLGQPLAVTLKQVDLEARQLRFQPAAT